MRTSFDLQTRLLATLVYGSILTLAAVGCGDDAKQGGGAGAGGGDGAGTGASHAGSGAGDGAGDGAAAGDGAGQAGSHAGGASHGGGAGSSASAGDGAGGDSASTGGDDGGGAGDGSQAGTVSVSPTDGPVAGNPDGHCAIPDEAQAEDSSHPDHVVGDGTAASCTSAAFIDAVAQGGVITFNCGADPITIKLDDTAKVFNDKGPKIVIDGGDKVTLDGQGKRILYQDTCDQAQHWTTAQCDNQPEPELTVQNLTFQNAHYDGGNHGDGGGAIWASGGRFKAVHSRFFGNSCKAAGEDVAGGAIRAFNQSNNLPVYIVNSTFGGEPGLGNTCASGGALASIGVSWTVLNSIFSYNEVTDPTGGGGGAIGNDGNTMTLSICGTKIEHNKSHEGGGAIFFSSNDHSGEIIIKDSQLSDNTDTFASELPGIFYLAKSAPTVDNSTIQ